MVLCMGHFEIYVLDIWAMFPYKFCMGICALYGTFRCVQCTVKPQLYELIRPAPAVHITEPSSYNCSGLQSDAGSMNKQESWSTQTSIVTHGVSSMQSDHLLILIHHIMDDLPRCCADGLLSIVVNRGGGRGGGRGRE